MTELVLGFVFVLLFVATTSIINMALKGHGFRESAAGAVGAVVVIMAVCVCALALVGFINISAFIISAFLNF